MTWEVGYKYCLAWNDQCSCLYHVTLTFLSCPYNWYVCAKYLVILSVTWWLNLEWIWDTWPPRL